MKSTRYNITLTEDDVARVTEAQARLPIPHLSTTQVLAWLIRMGAEHLLAQGGVTVRLAPCLGGTPKPGEKRWQEMNIGERALWRRANPGQRHPSLGPDDDENRLAADWAKSPATPTRPEAPAPSD
jgi:hypothetical protein